MIISLYRPNMDDEYSINTNIAYLLKKVLNHRVVNLNSLSNDFDGQSTMYIVGHGTPHDIGKITPQELAVIIGNYINGVYQMTGISINKIYFSGCNTGKNFEGKPSCAEIFATELSKLLETEEVIEVIAPNGVLVYYPNGGTAVIEDNDPYKEDDHNLEAVAEIDTSDIFDAEEKITPYLAKIPFHSFNAFSIKKILKSSNNLKVDVNLDNKNSPYLHKSGRFFALNSQAYNLITEEWAALNSDSEYASNLKNSTFYNGSFS